MLNLKHPQLEQIIDILLFYLTFLSMIHNDIQIEKSHLQNLFQEINENLADLIS